ncbi:MAG: CapA family protein [Candidatus Goldiibacteriota bacterium]
MKKIRGLLFLTAVLMFFSCAGPGIKKQRNAEIINKDEPCSITIGGDIMLGRRMDPFMDEKGAGYTFEKIRSILANSKINFANLETPVMRNMEKENYKKVSDKQIHFLAREETGGVLAEAGINIVSLANNHALDYGEKGLYSTIKILDENNINYQGVWKGDQTLPNEPYIAEIDNTKAAFFSYSKVSHESFAASMDRYGTIPAILKVIRKDIADTRDYADIIIIYLHWGEEYRPVTEKQRVFAARIIDAGADMVVGSHTHIFQDIEKYKGKYIFYGLGNYIFDQTAKETKRAGILKISLKDGRIERAGIVPIISNEEFVPHPVTDIYGVMEFIKDIKLHNTGISEVLW